MSKEQLGQSIVIDNGTGVVKAGFAGDDAPRRFKKKKKKNFWHLFWSVFPSLIGKPKKPKYILPGMGLKNVYVGRDAERKRGILKLEYPLDHGVVQDWGDMEVSRKKKHNLTKKSVFGIIHFMIV